MFSVQRHTCCGALRGAQVKFNPVRHILDCALWAGARMMTFSFIAALDKSLGRLAQLLPAGRIAELIHSPERNLRCNGQRTLSSGVHLEGSEGLLEYHLALISC